MAKRKQIQDVPPVGLSRSQVTLDLDTYEVLEMVQEEVAGVDSRSAAIRYVAAYWREHNSKPRKRG
jgi:hypothetical protein